MSKKIIKYEKNEICFLEKSLDIISGKWSFLIIEFLFNGTKRFGEISKELQTISPKTLTAKLRELENHGMLTRKIYPTIPPTVEYTLTAKGLDYQKIIKEMCLWGEKWIS